jgi:hypothetical protein
MNIRIHRTAVAITMAVMLGVAATSGAALARGAQVGGGRYATPFIGSVPSNPAPQFNASSPYTVAPSAETPVSPASPGSVFH